MNEPTEVQGRAVLAKAARRLVPVLFAAYVIAYVDRVNIGYAALQMNADLGLSGAAYGLGAGVFFVGYFVVEVPSNMALERVGARLWITRIMVTWGLLAAATCFVRGETSLYLLRFLLGVAEAGLFPGVILYFTYWFPSSWRIRAVAGFMTAIPIAGVIASPLSGVLLTWGDGLFGFRGWQVMFVLEGLAAVLFAVVVLIVLPDGPGRARWLAEPERAWIARTLAREEAGKPDRPAGLTDVLRNGPVWGFTAVYFLFSAAIYGITLWLGLILKGASGSGPLVVGLLGAIPYLVATVAMILYARHSDRTGERRRHCVVGAVVAAVGFALTGLAQDSVAFQIVTLAVAASGILCALTTFWGLPTGYLTASMAAVGIAVINSVGNLGGFLGPYAVGAIQDATGRFYGGMVLLAACALAGGGLLAVLSRGRAPARAGTDTEVS